MFWKINYAIDDGYAIHSRVCIINEISKGRALKVFNTQIKSNLNGNQIVCGKYTQITLCDNDVLIYDCSSC